MLFNWLMSLMILTSMLASCTQKDQHTHAGASNPVKDPTSKQLIYQCPMHPQITSTQAGSCPICGMKLVLADVSTPVGSTSGHDPSGENATPPTHTTVVLAERRQQLIGIKTVKAESRKLFKSIRAPGRIAFDPDLYIAQGEYLEALKQWNRVKESPLADVKRSTQEMIKSSRIRLRVLGLSDDQIQQLAAQGTLSEGLLVAGAGKENWIYAEIFEGDLALIKPGLSVEITASAFKETLAGVVVSVDQLINPETRTAKARIRLKKDHLSLRPELYVDTTIFAPLGQHLAVPLEALLDTGREILLFVKTEPGHFEPRRVRVPFETDEYAAIASGLAEGEEVVVGGNFMLDSESRLKAVVNISTTHQKEGRKP
ncbi:MAG: efflux RND transporter periplasmic adaptor subunit [Oligoflexus sp.]|jgi:Cu(I)/Ag(I) efflux system membrane fusion protein